MQHQQQPGYYQQQPQQQQQQPQQHQQGQQMGYQQQPYQQQQQQQAPQQQWQQQQPYQQQQPQQQQQQGGFTTQSTWQSGTAQQQQQYQQQQQQYQSPHSASGSQYGGSQQHYAQGQSSELIHLNGASQEDRGIEVHVRSRRSQASSTPNNSWSGAVDGSGSMNSSMSSHGGSEAGDLGHIQPSAPQGIQGFQQQQQQQPQQQQQQYQHQQQMMPQAPPQGGVPAQGLPPVPGYPPQQMAGMPGQQQPTHHVALPPVPQMPTGFPQQQPMQMQPGAHPAFAQPQAAHPMFATAPTPQAYPQQQMGLMGGPGGGGAPVQLGPVPGMPGQMPQMAPPQQQQQQPQSQPQAPQQPTLHPNLAHPQPGQDQMAFAASLLSRLREETQDSNLELMVNNLTTEQMSALMAFLNANATTVQHLCEKERGKVLTQVLARTGGQGCEEMVKAVCGNIAFLATHRVGCVAITRTVKALTGDTSGTGRGNPQQPVAPPLPPRTPEQVAASQGCMELLTYAALRLLPELAKHDHGNFVCSSVLGKLAPEAAFVTAWNTCYKVKPDFFVDCACSKAGSHVIDAFVSNAPKAVLEDVVQCVFMANPESLSQMSTNPIANYPLQGLIRTLRAKLVQAGGGPGPNGDAQLYNSPQWVWLQENIPKYCLASPHYTNILVALTGEGSGPMRRRKDANNS